MTKLDVVRANGIRFTCYRRGEGEELIVLLHGFPDDAATMLTLMERLDSTRFTIVAPHMRGFAPTSRSSDRRYHYADLGRDALGLIEAFGFERAQLYGHGFGALAGYAAAQLDARAVAHLVAAGVPPPRALVRHHLRQPWALRRSWHVALLQLPWIAELALGAQDKALVATLWRLWSPSWRFDRDRLAKVKSSLSRHKAMNTVGRYYRGLLLDAVLDPVAWRESFELARRAIASPTTILRGERDGSVEGSAFERLEGAFSTPQVKVCAVPECGHFIHHERPDLVIEALERGEP